MTEPAIRTDGISKRYRIAGGPRYGRLTESLAAAVKRPFRRSHADDERRTVWALRDVTLAVPKGEVLGVIGRNGAGKTTLLKVLSRVTVPTAGSAEVRGRIGTFLEVGTGFHPELSGRENVYLNGAILGLRKAEIDQRFDEIVAFAEVDRFLDTAVKFYSSGMQMRLAFAVAAHLDTEVLFVDEVLTVGDYRFQQKCLETMRNVGATGNTVVMVSHDLSAIRAFCTSCIWLDEGRIVMTGGVEECVRAYLTSGSAQSGATRVDVRDHQRPSGQGAALRFEVVEVKTARDDAWLKRGEPLVVGLTFSVQRRVDDVSMGFSVYAADGTWVLQCLNTHSGAPYASIEPGRYTVEATIPHNVLVEGSYVIGVGARGQTEGLDWVRDVVSFDVSEADEGRSWWLDPARSGLVRLESRFGPLEPASGDR